MGHSVRPRPRRDAIGCEKTAVRQVGRARRPPVQAYCGDDTASHVGAAPILVAHRSGHQALPDVAGFYRAFGFTLAEGASEKVDHLVCELEFLAMLCVMHAKAREEGNKDGARVSKHALRAFALDHLGEWLPAFCDRLMETTTLPFYRQAATLLLGVWRGIAENNRLPSPKLGAVTGALGDLGTPYECGMAGAA